MRPLKERIAQPTFHLSKLRFCVRELGSRLKLAAMQAKEDARASKTEQRTRELENRQLQLAAMVSALELANRAIQANTGNAGRSDTDENDANHTTRDEM